MAIEYKRRDITVDDYHRMDDAGIFHPDERVELIDGELIEMAPLGLSHWSRHAILTRYFINRFGDRALVVPQGSFPLGRRNEPQPDLAILANIDYAARNERPTLDEIYAFVGRELTYGDSFAFAALSDLTLSADVFLDGRSA